jgi:YD repeat-containing protein
MERDAAGARKRTILDERHDVHHARDLFGREVARALPSGGRIHHAYDRLGRVQRRWATSPGSLRPVRFDDPAWAGPAVAAQPPVVTAEREYLYNADGELSDALDRRRGWVQYDYDPEGRLLAVFHEATRKEEAFRYDAAGNPYEVDGEKEMRTYGPGGRLLQRGDATYRWDEAGRLQEKRTPSETWRYVWDGAGRLAAVDLPDGRHAEYVYDPLGRRVEERLYGAPPPAGRARIVERSRFVWDGDTLVHAIRTRANDEDDPIVEERTFAFEDGSFVPWAQCDETPDAYGGRRRRWLFFVNDPIGTPDELVGERALNRLFPAGDTQKAFEMRGRPDRRVDNFEEGTGSQGKGIAREAKAGRICLDDRIKSEIERDKLLKRRGVDVEWHFFKSPVTGQIGPTPALRGELSTAGITVIEHPRSKV